MNYISQASQPFLGTANGNAFRQNEGNMGALLGPPLFSPPTFLCSGLLLLAPALSCDLALCSSLCPHLGTNVSSLCVHVCIGENVCVVLQALSTSVWRQALSLGSRAHHSVCLARDPRDPPAFPGHCWDYMFATLKIGF